MHMRMTLCTHNQGLKADNLLTLYSGISKNSMFFTLQGFILYVNNSNIA